MTWKVVVADDEPVILAGIRKFVEQSGCDCQVVDEANDGIEAINMIERYNPNIVVSDIQMPGATGLEIIKKFYEKENCPKFIFISGYDEFKYVQEALRYEAVDYLLKPVSAEDIKDRLKKAIKKLSNEETINILKNEEKKIKSFWQSINSENEIKEEQFAEKCNGLIEEYKDNLFIGVGFNISFVKVKNEGSKYEKRELMKFIIYDYIGDYYKERKVGYITNKDDLGCRLILIIPKCDRKNYLEKYIMPLKSQVENEYSVKLHIGIGKIVEGRNNMQSAYSTAEFVSRLYYFEEKEIIIYRKDIINETFDDYEYKAEIVFNELISKYGNVLLAVENVLKSIEKENYGDRSAVLNRSSLFIEDIYRKMKHYNLDIEEIQKFKNKILIDINETETFSQLRKIVLNYFYEINEIIMKNDSIREKIEIATVKKYIKENYEKDITLKMLAHMIGMNSTYFSVFFKKNAGENYITYLTKIRMKEAHRLLMTTDMLTYEIAEKVGYNTVRRFTETFKKTYGYNPMEYKKRIYK